MAAATDVKYSHAKELWNKLSASFIQISPEEVDLELENAREQFQKGLLVLKEANVDGIQELKDKSGGYNEVLETISNMTGLDSKMSKIILKNYLMYDFRGAGATIMDYMTNEDLKKKLFNDLWLCYLKERLFILHCMKLVWVYGNTDGHPYQANFKAFIDTLDANELIENLLVMIETLAEKQPPKMNAFLVMNKDLMSQWCNYKLWGQIILSHIALEVVTTRPVSIVHVLRFFELYKLQEFGYYPGLPVCLEEKKPLYQFLAVSEIAVLIHLFMQAPDIFIDSESKSAFENLKYLMSILEADKYQGLLLLAFDLSPLTPKDSPGYQTLINKAMEVNQFKFFDAFMKNLNNMNDIPMQDIMSKIILKLVIEMEKHCFLNLSNEGSLIYDVLGAVLRNKECCEFFLQDTQHTLANVVKYAMDMFPYLQTPLVHLVTSFATSGNIDKAMDLVDGIKCYTEKFAPSNCMRIFNDYGTAQAVKHSVCDGLIEISRETVGGVSHVPSLPMLVHWQIHYNFWDVIFAGLKKASHSVVFCGGHVPSHTACYVDCIKSVLQAGHVGDQKMSAAIREVFELADSLCRQKQNPDMILLASIMEIMTVVAQTHCEMVCLSASSTSIIPYSKILPFSTPSMMDTIEYGVINFILTHSKSEGPFLQNYLNFLLEIIKHPDVPAGVIGAGINVIITCVFPQHPRWEYKKAEDRDDLGFLCLKLCHALLSPVVVTPKIPVLQKFCLECLLIPCATGILLDTALIGERALEFTMLDQSSHFTGRGSSLMREVQMSLSVLNLLLKKLCTALPPDGTCYLLEHLTTSRQGHRNNIYSRLGDYLHCTFFPQITTLAIRVLESIFQAVPVAFHAHLSKTDDTIHQMFTLRLLAEDEYPHLRTAIIDLISTCVRTGSQAQLMEIFFFDKDKNNKSNSSEGTSNKGFTPILDYFLGVVQSPSQNISQVSTSIYMSVINLMCSCWSKPTHFLRTMMKSSKDFWKYLYLPMHCEIQETPVYAGIFHIICYEIIKSSESNADLDAETSNFLEKRCIVWNQLVIDPILASILNPETVFDTERKHLEAWGTFLVLMLKERKNLLPPTLIDELSEKYLDILLEFLKQKFESPFISIIAQVLLHFLESKCVEFGNAFTKRVTRLIGIVQSKYVYFEADTRTVLLSVLFKLMKSESFNVSQVLYQGCKLVSNFGTMMMDEALHVPRYTVGNIGNPMLYCCVLQFLKLALPYPVCLQQLGHTNMFVNIMKNSSQIIKNRSNLMCADIAMNVLVTASRCPILVKFLMITELEDLFVALTSCKHDVDWKKSVEWEEVYAQGLVLCGNVMGGEPALAVKYVMRFVVEHQQYLLSQLKFLHNRMDRKGLLIAWHSSKLFNSMCDSKINWEYNSELSSSAILSASLICLDLCILFLIRPKIQISSYPEKPAKPDDFKHPSEKFNFLLEIAKECLDCLCKLTSPDLTQLQQFAMLPDTRVQKLVVQVQLTPTPSLARDYKPAPSFGHLNALSLYCLQIILKKQRDKNVPAKEPSQVEPGVCAAIAYKTLNSCIEFTYLQGKAFIQNCSEPPHVIAAFRKELTHEMNYLLDGVRRKQLLTPVQAGDSDPNATQEVDLSPDRPSHSSTLQF